MKKTRRTKPNKEAFEIQIPQHLLDHGYTEKEAKEVASGFCWVNYGGAAHNYAYDEENDWYETGCTLIRDSTGGLGTSFKRYK